MKTAKPKFVYVTYIECQPATLWKALTTTEIISQYWFGRINTSQWKKGSDLESRSPEGELEWKGRILESKRLRRLVYTFDVVDSKEGPSRVTFDIETPKRTGRRGSPALKLTVTHDQFPAGSKILPKVSSGWPGILSSLKTMLETGRALEFEK